MARKSKKTSQYENDLKNVLATDSGRRVLWNVLVNAGTNAPVIGGSTDLTLINAGAHSVGIDLQSDIVTVAPQRFVQMLQENNPKADLTPDENEDEDEDNV